MLDKKIYYYWHIKINIQMRGGKMKKKIAKLMLGTMFLTGVLSGCGSNTKETAGGDNNGNKYDLTLYRSIQPMQILEIGLKM